MFRDNNEEMFRKNHINEFKKISSNHFVTSSNLLYSSKEIGNKYDIDGIFPKILIIDDIVIHGRSLNQFLLSFEENVFKSSKKISMNVITNSIIMKAFIRNKKPLLLYARYQNSLFISEELNKSDWKTYYKRASDLIAFSNRGNTERSLSFAIKSSDEEPSGTISSNDFKEVVTDMQNKKEYNFVWMYPNENSPKMIATIRFKQSYIKENKYVWVCTPCILFGNTNLKNAEKLNEIIPFDYLMEDINRYQDSYERITDIIYLLLNLLILKKFFNELILSNDDPIYLENYVDYELLLRSYKDVLNINEITNHTLKGSFELFIHQKYDESILMKYISMYTSEMDCIWNNLDDCLYEQRDICSAETLKNVEDLIYRASILTEKNSYERSISSMVFNEKVLSEWGYECSISSFFSFYIYDIRSKGYKINIYDAVALFTQAIDLGIINLKSDFRNDEITTLIRATEYALFIKAIRYRNYNFILEKVIKTFGDSWVDVNRKLGRFEDEFTKKYSLQTCVSADDLTTFLKDISSIGQTIDENTLCHYNYIDIVYPRTNTFVTEIDGFLNDINIAIRYNDAYGF